MKIGILTGGGDCPGLNAVIRAVVRKGVFHYDDQFVGFMEGWRGLVEDKSMGLDLDAVSGILPRGGTILRTSRTNPSKRPDGFDRCMKTIATHKIDALVAIGGDDAILIPERPFNVDKVAEYIRQRHERGRYFSIVVVAEGAKFSTGSGAPVISDMGKDEFGHAKLGGIANVLAREIEQRTGFET